MTKLCFGWRKSRKHEKETQTPSGSCASPVQQPKIEAKKAAPAPSFPDGVEVWCDCPDAALDICFVHGLTGDRNHTWTADGERVPWPKTFLPPRLAKTRILTYGYDAYVVKKTTASVNRLLDHANNLLQDFSTDRAICGVGKRPVVFVAHSLGGLVCKKAILQSAESPQPRLRALFESTKGIIFLGTPHDGSSMAAWAKIPASALSLVKSTNLSLLGVLGSDNELLESIQVSFRNLVRTSKANGKPIEVTCFFEQLPILGVGVVVSKRSAAIAGEEEPMSINADHRGMTKFTSVEDNGFKRLFGELIRWKSEIDADNLLPTDSRPDPDMLAACLDTLLFPQMHSRSHDIERPVEGTCEWLLEHTTLREWAERQRGMLWIKGKPGSGKSTLLKYAFEKRQRIISTGEDSLVLSFFFHDRGNHLQKSPVGFLRSLAYQIIRQVPEILTGSGDPFQQRCREVHRQGDKGEWHPRELQDFVEQSLSKILASRGAWLFVDALDECGKASAVEMFKWFTHLMKKLSVYGFGLHLCVSCRHYPILSQACEFEICPEHQNREDMSAYVQSRFQGSGSLQKSKIPDLITYRASGVFMWARIVIDEAINLDNEGESLASIETRVTSIPKKLDELYSELIGHMNDKPNSLRLIQWVCFARRALTLSELRWAMVIDPESSNRLCEYYSQHHDYIRDKDQLKRRIQTLSCGLAEILPTEEGHVQLVHQSAKDFLLERGLAMLDYKASSPHGTVVGKAHFCLAKSCLRYLALDIMADFDSMKRKTEDSIKLTAPLLSYAVSSWPEHAMRSDEEGVPQDDILEIVAWPSNDLVELWMSYSSMLNLLHPQPDKGSNLVHISALYDIPGLLAAVYRKAGHDHPYCRHDRGHTPLNIASVRGRRKIAKMLIDPDYAMRVAAATGMESTSVKPTTDATDLGRGGSDPRPKSVVKIVPLPLNKDVEINSQGFEGRTPLLGAVCGGHVDIVKLLLKTGKADINAKDRWGGTALAWAVLNCSSEIVELLLATGELQLEPVDHAGGTPLSIAAAKRGSLQTLQLLLDTGKVDVNRRCLEGRTPLSYAAGQGYIDNVEALLKEEKIDINSRDCTGRTALTWALRGLKDLETMAPLMDLASMQELRWAYEKTVELLSSVGAVTEETQQ